MGKMLRLTIDINDSMMQVSVSMHLLFSTISLFFLKNAI